MSTVIVDLGVGNTASVAFALERLGARPRLSRVSTEIAEAERLILPGVGTAAFAMRRIEALGLAQTLRVFPRPLLGLCLGQQLLYEASDEGGVRCLGIIAGRVQRLQSAPDRPVPHMGWNRLRRKADDLLLDGVQDGAYVYFVHSYARLAGPETLATVDYGGEFAAVVRQKNFWSCQFHPERSSAVGRRILANFLALPC
jgi:glutamine amidotransferase